MAAAVVCQVPGCREPVPDVPYHKRCRICLVHQNELIVVMGGKNMRFCSLCKRFHTLPEFDGDRKNCRASLERHNKRRRQRKTSALAAQAGVDAGGGQVPPGAGQQAAAGPGLHHPQEWWPVVRQGASIMLSGPVTEGDMAQWEAGQQATPAVQPPQPAEQPAPLYLHVEQQPRQPPAPQQPASQPLSEQRPPKPPLSPHLHPGLPQQAQPWGLAGGAMHAAPGVLPEAEAAVPPPLAVLPGELIRLGTLGDLSMALGSLDFEELGASLAALGDLSVSQLSVVMGPLEPPPRAAGGAGPGTAAEGAAGRQQLPQQPGSFGFLDPARLEDLSIVLSSLDRSPQGFGGEEEEAGLPGPEQQQQQLWEQLDSGAGEQPPQYDLPPAAAPPPGHLHAAALSLASLRDLSMALGSLDLRDLPPELRSLRLSDLSMMLGSLDLGALPRDDRSLRLAELSKELGTLREEELHTFLDALGQKLPSLDYSTLEVIGQRRPELGQLLRRHSQRRSSVEGGGQHAEAQQQQQQAAPLQQPPSQLQQQGVPPTARPAGAVHKSINLQYY